MSKRAKRNKKNAKNENCGVTKGGFKRKSKFALAKAWEQEKAKQMHGFWKP